jgi:hypothetical protein
MALSVELAAASPQEIGQFVSDGTISAQVALDEMFARGHLAIGTVISKPEHTKSRAMNNVNGVWRPIAKTETGSALEVVRASRVARTVIACAVLGDCNEVNQRRKIGSPLVEAQDGAAALFGWRPDDEASDNYRIRADGRLLAAVLRDPEAIVGVADIVEDDGSWRELDGPNAYTDTYEPNHYVSENTHATLGSIPISGAVLLSLSNIEATSPIR